MINHKSIISPHLRWRYHSYPTEASKLVGDMNKRLTMINDNDISLLF